MTIRVVMKMNERAMPWYIEIISLTATKAWSVRSDVCFMVLILFNDVTTPSFAGPFNPVVLYVSLGITESLRFTVLETCSEKMGVSQGDK